MTIDVANSLREAFFMFWHTLWPLVLGFTLSGIVQAWVSHERMQQTMGDHRAPAVLRATGFGMISSSCSYAAAAMSKSLFQKGADFTTAMIFMFASTNLVIELGVVLLILMGWQFALAEFVGGPIMIALLALTGGAVISTRRAALARRHLEASQAAEHDHHDMAGVSDERLAELEAEPFGRKLRDRAAWADAASYAVADLKMLRKELAIGYLVAGFLTVNVTTDIWNDIFFSGHGFWTSLQNVIVGPFIAIVSFVCSVGNVPLAAALWHGGISFGGVVAFIFADLITLPLLLVYRKYYGGRLTLRLLAWFWAVMAIAGLAVEGLFSVSGLIPAERHAHEHMGHTIQLNYTTVLNVIAIAGFAFLYWLYRNRDRWGGGQDFAIDPVCGMQVRVADAPARATVDGRTHFFCCDGCRDRFLLKVDRQSQN